MARRSNSRLMGAPTRPYCGESDDWLTPPEILKALGPFDLDPCCPPSMPWKTATVMHTPADDGLAFPCWPWHGRVWLNPPYGPNTAVWLERLAQHGDGVALIFARTDTVFFHRLVWKKADALLFLRGRLHFHNAKGERAKHNSGGPSVLVAYGSANAECLRRCELPGAFVRLKESAP
jgi:hypothetical protein